MTLQNIKISLRSDSLENWISSDPVLKNGELVMVNDISAGLVRFKIGNGVSAFVQLPYVNEKKVITDFAKIKRTESQYFSQGVNNFASPLGFAAGSYLTADSSFAQVLGINACAPEGHDYSFVWNGDSSGTIGVQSYKSHGEGTFNVNPADGVNGVYIGNQTLSGILSSTCQPKGNYLSSNALDGYSTYADTKSSLSSDGYATQAQLDAKSAVSVDNQRADVNILHISQEEYNQLVAGDATLSNTLYVVSSDYIEAYGQQIKNVATPTDLSDAVNKEYVDSNFQQAGDYLDKHTGGEVSGDVGIAQHNVNILSGNFIQTNTPDSVYVYSADNSFIQAQSTKYGSASIGSRGFIILGVTSAENKVVLSTDGTAVSDIIPTSCYASDWSIALDNYLDAQFSEISTVGDDYVIFKNSLKATAVTNGKSEEYFKGLIKDDNALYCPTHPEIGNCIIPTFTSNHAEGGSTHATAQFAHAEGRYTFAEGRYSHAEGHNAIAAGTAAHAEGMESKALNNYGTHAEGYQTSAFSKASHSEGRFTSVKGDYSHAEGYRSKTGETLGGDKSEGAHAEGYQTLADGDGAHSEGRETIASNTGAHAEGYKTEAFGIGSHAEGGSTTNFGGIAFGNGSHSEGYQNIAIGNASHAEGHGEKTVNTLSVINETTLYSADLGSTLKTYGDYNSAVRIVDNNKTAYITSYDVDGTSISIYLNASIGLTEGNVQTQIYKQAAYQTTSHVEGYNCRALGESAHAEGSHSIAKGNFSHAEGRETKALETYTHAEGYKTTASGQYSHAEGSNTQAVGTKAHAEGDTSIASGNFSHAEGYQSKVGQNKPAGDSEGAHAEGYQTYADGDGAHSEGRETKADGNGAHAEGVSTKATGQGAHAEGVQSEAQTAYSHAEGYNTRANGEGAHAEGQSTLASGVYSHAEGNETSATNQYSHAEGLTTLASGTNAHSEGQLTTASGKSSHAEGSGTSSKRLVAEGDFSHAEGACTYAKGSASHAEGYNTVSEGGNSHAEGGNTKAQNNNEHAEGKYNLSHKASDSWGNAGNTIHSIGIGTAENDRKNAVEVMQDGKVFVKDIGGYDGTNPTANGVKDLAAVLSSNLRYALSTATSVLSSGSYVYEVNDRTMTTIGINQSTTPVIVRLPDAGNGARDFILRIEISSSAAPTFTFTNTTGLDFESEDDDWAVMQPGVNLISFTETKR